MSSPLPPRWGSWAAFLKLEHTLFSLPVLLGGAFLATKGLPDLTVLAWIVVAGTGARSLALALNRLIDRRIDALNPRTTDRELPSGKLRLGEAWTIAVAGALVYLGACAMLPPICLWLSPVPVIAFLVYPYMKRFTAMAHLGVGFALALAPLGSFVAVTGSLDNLEPALWLSAFTLMWVAGFDVIYATLDEEFDRHHGLHSLPVRFGSQRALWCAAALHGLALAALLGLYGRFLQGSLALVGIGGAAVLLLAENRLAHRVNLAFFQLNIVVGFVVFAVVVVGQASL